MCLILIMASHLKSAYEYANSTAILLVIQYSLWNTSEDSGVEGRTFGNTKAQDPQMKLLKQNPESYLFKTKSRAMWWMYFKVNVLSLQIFPQIDTRQEQQAILENACQIERHSSWPYLLWNICGFLKDYFREKRDILSIVFTTYLRCWHVPGILQ